MSRVRVATSAVLACLVVAGCPSSHPGRPIAAPKAADDRPLRIAVARAEARREDGVHELQQLVETGDAHARQLALRGLGRIGGRAARALLVARLDDADPEIVAGALAALGVARELDDATYDDAIQARLRAAFARTSGAGRVLAIEALGRAGDPAAQVLIAGELAGPVDRAEAAGIALARHGRRKLALAPPTVKALLAALEAAEPRARYAATYALARASAPIDDPAVSAALVKRLADPVADIRAQAILATGKHGRSLQPIEAALLDRDWHVAVEAVRALTGDKASADFADAVATALVRRISDPHDGDLHVMIEGLRGLQKQAARPVVAQAVTFLSQWAAAKSDLDHGWVECLATEGEVRAGGATFKALASCPLPDHLRLPLIADLVTANVGALSERRTALAMLLGHKDVRVRAAGLGALTAPWKEGSDADHASAVGVLVGALASPDSMLAGSAVDAAAGFYDAIGTGDHSAIDGAVIARATTETDPELSGALLELIGKHKLAAGLEACRAGLAGMPVRAAAARECLRALGEAAPDAVTSAHAPAPPVDVATVIGRSVVWHLVTTRGELSIALSPEVAPWAVASIVALTRKGSYDGLEFHRVVPDFVVQGGDPTESGWGGPGYTLPAEPGTTADGAGFVVGGVGLADAGKDSAGSQWFVMHARAAHLDGRYTWIGAVIDGQKSADALQIGDKVVKATVVVRDP